MCVFYHYVYRYSIDDNLRDGYTYTVGICTTALGSTEAKGEFKSAGAIQTHKSEVNSDHPKTHIIGSFEQAEIMSGSMFHKYFLSIFCFHR